MPLLPLPEGDSHLIGGDVPVNTAEDVLVEFSRPHRNPAAAPVRDAFAAAFAEGFKKYQNIASRATAQTNPLTATGDYLKAFAEERGIVPKFEETEESLRERLFSAPAIVTPQAIVDQINEILAPYSNGTCRIAEIEMDGWFVHDGTATWDSFVGASPEYPDRYYDYLPDLDPGGAIPSWGYLRSFLIRIPPLEQNDETISYVLNDSDDGLFVDNGTSLYPSFFLFTNPQLSEDLYNQIIGLVDNIKGQGMTYTLLVDPSLIP